MSKKSVICNPDDLNVGELYAVLGPKGSDAPIPINGLSFRIKALNLPYFVGQPCPPGMGPITLDVRYLNIMRVSEEYANAQRGEEPKQQMPPEGFELYRPSPESDLTEPEAEPPTEGSIPNE